LIRRTSEAAGVASAISLWISPTLWTYATASRAGPPAACEE
jgi:hypothetical protein